MQGQAALSFAMRLVQFTMYVCGLDKSVDEVHRGYIPLQTWLEQSEKTPFPVAILQSEDTVSSAVLNLSEQRGAASS